jgi:hypothetical protein
MRLDRTLGWGGRLATPFTTFGLWKRPWSVRSRPENSLRWQWHAAHTTIHKSGTRPRRRHYHPTPRWKCGARERGRRQAGRAPATHLPLIRRMLAPCCTVGPCAASCSTARAYHTELYCLTPSAAEPTILIRGHTNVIVFCSVLKYT